MKKKYKVIIGGSLVLIFGIFSISMLTLALLMLANVL
jgi:hypothetical protein